MSRIRTIKPDAFRSETLSEVSLSAERTFFGLLTEVDDRGRIKERPAVLNGALWSLRPEHSVRDMERDLDELQTADLICRYEVNGIKHFHLPTFAQHQRINRPSESKLAPCPTCPVRRGGGVPDDVFTTESATAPQEPSLFDAGDTSADNVTPFPSSERRG
jgi:hypothetical protein